MSATVLCTTIHPQVLPYLAPFLASVAGQSDADVDVWFALDGVPAGQVRELLPSGLRVRFIDAPPGVAPAEVRTVLFSAVCQSYELAILADADDVLETSRVAAAKAATREVDVSACAMSLIDEAGADLGYAFGALPDGSPAALDELLAHGNVFGLSNSCYRTAVLDACLPVPPGCTVVDWYLATAARLHGGRLALDPERHMRYRQHRANIAPVLPPFSAASIVRATGIVRGHHELVANLDADDAPLRAALRAARSGLDAFAAAIAEPALLERYVRAVNALPPPQAWWTMVANPELEGLWRP
jgi:hypothetical protein